MNKEKLKKMFLDLLDMAIGDSENHKQVIESDVTTPEGVQVRKSVDVEERRALFVVLAPQESETETEDLHGDVYFDQDVIEACRSFNVHCMKANLMHSVMLDSDLAVIEQSYTSPVEFVIENPEGEQVTIRKNTWLQEWYFPEPDELAEDVIWPKVKDGTFTGLSVYCEAYGQEIK